MKTESIYKCSAGETFDSVALMLYGAEEKSCELLCANPALCTKMVFTGGEVLTIPTITEDDAELDNEDYMPPTAPWKEE